MGRLSCRVSEMRNKQAVVMSFNLKMWIAVPFSFQYRTEMIFSWEPHQFSIASLFGTQPNEGVPSFLVLFFPVSFPPSLFYETTHSVSSQCPFNTSIFCTHLIRCIHPMANRFKLKKHKKLSHHIKLSSLIIASRHCRHHCKSLHLAFGTSTMSLRSRHKFCLITMTQVHFFFIFFPSMFRTGMNSICSLSGDLSFYWFHYIWFNCLVFGQGCMVSLVPWFHWSYICGWCFYICGI